MKPHRKRAPSRGPFRTAESQGVLLVCEDCELTMASEDARKYLGLEVVTAAGWRPIERWREKLDRICPRRGCETRLYRVCSRHAKHEVIYELCPTCRLILFDGEGYEALTKIIEAARAAPAKSKPEPHDLIDRWVSEPPKKKD